MTREFTLDQVKAAITGDDPRYYNAEGKRMGCAGIMSTVARRLSCEWHTAQRWVNKWESTRQAFKNEGEQVLDLAESKAIEQINSGDGAMIRYFLSTQGKKRGYTTREEVVQDGDVTFRVIYEEDDA